MFCFVNVFLYFVYIIVFLSVQPFGTINDNNNNNRPNEARHSACMDEEFTTKAAAVYRAGDGTGKDLPVRRRRCRTEAAVSAGMDACGTGTRAGDRRGRGTGRRAPLGHVIDRCAAARRHPARRRR